MAQVEMVIDSVRTGNRLKNERVVILREKTRERYLPIYMDYSHADTVGKMLVGEQCPGPVFDDPSLRGIGRFLSLADSVSLIIERFDEDVFYTKFLIAWRGESYQIDCPCAWALALGVRAGARIFAEETVLHQAGISVAT